MQISADEKKVLVALSGRVDSSVTAALLKTEGYQVSGLHLRFQIHDDIKRSLGLRCLAGSTEKDEKAAQEVCAKLEIPFHGVDVGDSFLAEVIDSAVTDTLQLRRPAPCLACHQKIKLATLFKEADARKHHWVATGHYVQVAFGLTGANERSAQLNRASDSIQDQSHLLFGLGQSALSRLLTPLGGISKKMVLKLAKEFDLPGQLEGPTPYQACEIRNRAFIDWVTRSSAAALRPSGIVRTARGELLGEHQGLYQFALGDRLGEGGITPTHPEENNVIGFDRATQTVILGVDEELFHSRFTGQNAVWIKPQDGIRGIHCRARIGNRAEQVPCRVTLFEANLIQVEFETPLRAVTPGDSLCFYEGEEVLGGAWIQGSILAEPRGRSSKS